MKQRTIAGLLLATLAADGRAQTAHTQSMIEPRKFYFLFKAHMFEQTGLPAVSLYEPATDGLNGKPTHFFHWCGTPYPPNYTADGGVTAWMVRLVSRVFEIEATLVAQRYPRRLWEGELAALENEAVAEYASTRRDEIDIDRYELARRINANIFKERFADHPAVTYAPCGGPPAFLWLTTSPPGGTVYFIPVTMYTFCRKLNIDPLDTFTCSYWNTVEHGGMIPFGGEYKYFVKWGSVQTDIKDINADAIRNSDKLELK